MTTAQAFPFYDKDLALLPPPEVYQQFDFETLFAERSASFNALHPMIFENGKPVYRQAELVQTDTETYWKVPLNGNAGLYYLDLESDPSTRHVQADTYRELLHRRWVLEAALSTLPAYAKGTNLDHIGLRYFGTKRLTIVADTSTSAAVMEDDTAYLKRMLLSPEGLARGGSTGWYVFHALSASGLVKDVTAVSPLPYRMTLTVLSHEGDGTASQELLDTVFAAVTEHHAFPQGDLVKVQSVEIVRYSLSATVQMYPGAGVEVVMQAISDAIAAYRAQSERIGHMVDKDGLYAAIRQPGVYRALIKIPAATNLPIAVGANQVAYCESVTVTEVDGD